MRQSIVLMCLAAGNIGLAFIYQWYAVIQLGPGMETDALFAAATVPQVVLGVGSGTLMYVLVPLLAGEPEHRFRQHAWSFFVLVGGAFVAISMLLGLTAPWWVPLTVPGFTDAGKDLTVHLARIQLVAMVFTSLAGVQSVMYQARQRFVWAELASLVSGTLCLIPLVWALPRYGVEAVAWTAVLRLGVQTMLQMPGMGKWTPPDLRAAAVVQAWRRVKPLLLSTAYFMTDPLVDRFLLSTSDRGSLSLFYLAQQVYLAAVGVLGKAISAPLMPMLSVLSKSGDEAGFRRAYRSKLLVMAALSGGAFVFILLFGQALLSLVIGHGAITQSNVAYLWQVMLGLGGLFVGGSVALVTTASFYARGNTGLPTRLGVITYTLFIPIKIVSFGLAGPVALAFSASAFHLANLALQFLFIEKGQSDLPQDRSTRGE